MPHGQPSLGRVHGQDDLPSLVVPSGQHFVRDSGVGQRQHIAHARGQLAGFDQGGNLLEAPGRDLHEKEQGPYAVPSSLLLVWCGHGRDQDAAGLSTAKDRSWLSPPIVSSTMSTSVSTSSKRDFWASITRSAPSVWTQATSSDNAVATTS